MFKHVKKWLCGAKTRASPKNRHEKKLLHYKNKSDFQITTPEVQHKWWKMEYEEEEQE